METIENYTLEQVLEALPESWNQYKRSKSGDHVWLIRKAGVLLGVGKSDERWNAIHSELDRRYPGWRGYSVQINYKIDEVLAA